MKTATKKRATTSASTVYCSPQLEDISVDSCKETQQRKGSVSGCQGCGAKSRFCVNCFHYENGKITFEVDRDTGLCPDCSAEIAGGEPPIPNPQPSGNGKKKEFKVVEIPIKNLMPDPEQPRKKFVKERMEELAESMRLLGQLETVIVYPHKEKKGKFVIISGERRFRVARDVLKLKKLKAVVISLEEKDNLYEIEAALNCCRSGYTIPELIQIISKLKAKGHSHVKIAKMLGYSQTYISTTARFRNLPQEVIAMLEPDAPEGERINRNMAIALLKIPKDQIDFIIKTAKGLAVEGVKAIEAPGFIEGRAREAGVRLDNYGTGSRGKGPRDYWIVIVNAINNMQRNLASQLRVDKDVLKTAFRNRETVELRRIIQDGIDAKEIMDKAIQFARNELKKRQEKKT